MQNVQPSLFSRNDTMLGICQGLGEDLGFNPDILRVAMIPALFFFPVYTIAGYFAAGVVVLLSRILFPNPRRIALQNETPEASPPHVEANGRAMPELEKMAA
jgi:phage shock protein C